MSRFRIGLAITAGLTWPVLVGANIPEETGLIPVEPFRAEDGSAPNQILIDDQIFTAEYDGPNILGYSGGSRWPGATIVFDTTSLTASQRSEFYSACNAWANGTPLSCKERIGESGYMRVRTHFGDQCGGFAGSSCSPVGYRNGRQEMYISASHWSSQYVLRHEIGHALGLWHEQNRSDRDFFVNVYYPNIQPGAEHNFDVQPGAVRSGYDFESIMHYRHCDFSKHPECNEGVEEIPNKWTLSHSACDMNGPLGNNNISFLDLESIRTLYFGANYRLALLRGSFEAGGEAAYSRDQLAQLDSNIYEARGSVVWTREWEHFSDSGKGGFLAHIDAKKLCARRGQEHKGTRYDTDDHIVYKTRERWITCGCSRAPITFLRPSVSPLLVPDYPAQLYNDYPKEVGNAASSLFIALQNLNITSEVSDGEEEKLVTDLDKTNLFLSFMMRVERLMLVDKPEGRAMELSKLTSDVATLIEGVPSVAQSVRDYRGKGAPADLLFEHFEQNGFAPKVFFDGYTGAADPEAPPTPPGDSEAI